MQQNNGELRIEYKDIDEVIPYENNPRQNDEAVEKVATSIENFGFKIPIVVDADDTIIAGHTRLKAAAEIGMDQVPVIKATDLNEQEVKAFRIADNRVTEESTWDFELLETELEDILQYFDVTDLGFDKDEMEEIADEAIEDEESYTDKIQAPTYEPTEEKPDIDELYDNDDAMDLIANIEKTKIPKKEKEFLKQAAQRHVKFDYRNIAEYYAHSSKEVQELMEQSALVIIDFDQAIQNGFVSFTEEVIESAVHDDE